MKAPAFWSDPGSLAGRLLAPAGWIYGAAGRWRRARARPEAVGVPVVCVGNLTAGGAGKTPVVIAIMQALEAMGARPHALSRGYGGRLTGPHPVDALRDTAADVGDEPLIIAAHGPMWISRDRATGARAAATAGAGAIVLDDGFQNPHLRKDLSILVIDGVAGFGSGRLIPAGPLREPIAEGLSRAQAVVVMGPGEPLKGRVFDGPILRADLRPISTGEPFQGARLAAFAGIGRPAKFFDMLRAEGAELVAAWAFPDHAVYDGRILRRLAEDAARLNARLVCTEKDAVKFPPWFRGAATPVPVTASFADKSAFDALLREVLIKIV